MTDNIYCSVPDHAFNEERKAEEDKKQSVLSYLKNSILPSTARRIAESCNLPTGGTQVEVRQIITRLIEVNHEPIIAIGKGFMIATSTEQLVKYANGLEERIKGIQRRVDAVRQIALTHSFGGKLNEKKDICNVFCSFVDNDGYECKWTKPTSTTNRRSTII